MLEDGHFKYGDLNAKVCRYKGVNTILIFHLQKQTYNKNAPYYGEAIAYIIRMEYFPVCGGANMSTFREMITTQRINGPTALILLLH